MSKKFSGQISIEIPIRAALEEFCAKRIPGYDAERLELVAVRVFAGKEFIVTVYAADKLSNKTVREFRYPVKKFKVENLPIQELFSLVEAYNFTLVSDDYNLEDIDVTNR